MEVDAQESVKSYNRILHRAVSVRVGADAGAFDDCDVSRPAGCFEREEERRVCECLTPRETIALDVRTFEPLLQWVCAGCLTCCLLDMLRRFAKLDHSLNLEI